MSTITDLLCRYADLGRNIISFGRHLIEFARPIFINFGRKLIKFGITPLEILHSHLETVGEKDDTMAQPSYKHIKQPTPEPLSKIRATNCSHNMQHMSKEEEKAGSEHSFLGMKHSFLAIEHSRLGIQHSQLGIEHSKLGKDHADIGLKHSRLGIEHSELGVEHANLGIEHSKLGIKHSDGVQICDIEQLGKHLHIEGAEHPFLKPEPAIGGMDNKSLQLLKTDLHLSPLQEYTIARPSLETEDPMYGVKQNQCQTSWPMVLPKSPHLEAKSPLMEINCQSEERNRLFEQLPTFDSSSLGFENKSVASSEADYPPIAKPSFESDAPGYDVDSPIVFEIDSRECVVKPPSEPMENKTKPQTLEKPPKKSFKSKTPSPKCERKVRKVESERRIFEISSPQPLKRHSKSDLKSRKTEQKQPSVELDTEQGKSIKRRQRKKRKNSPFRFEVD